MESDSGNCSKFYSQVVTPLIPTNGEGLQIQSIEGAYSLSIL